ncbi:hypothetical protein BDW75DRAFT_205118 [Aspergillus navahoensis]
MFTFVTCTLKLSPSSLNRSPPLQPLQVLERQAQDVLIASSDTAFRRCDALAVFVSAGFGFDMLAFLIHPLSFSRSSATPSSDRPLASPDAQEPTARRTEGHSAGASPLFPYCLLGATRNAAVEPYTSAQAYP